MYIRYCCLGTLCVKWLSPIPPFVTPWTVACQASLFMGFSRQEYWSGLPFPSPGDLPNPGIEPGSPPLQADALSSEPLGKHRSEVTQSCPTPCNPIDYSLQGFSVYGIVQARVLEWVAISFSRGSSLPRDRTRVSYTLQSEPPGKPLQGSIM